VNAEAPAADLRLRNDLAELPRLAGWVDAFVARHRLPSAIAYALHLALEEAVTNVITHGYADAEAHAIDVGLRVAGRTVRAEISDDGRPFDPRQAPPPDLAAPPEARRVGGLGVFLMKRLMDEIGYEATGGRNRLTLVKRLP
jgi:anti-sigma regulatory factor (Ser/Thr protein kinase)